VAARAVGPAGRVVGVDQARIDPPLDEANVAFVEADLTDRSTPERIRAELGGAADLVLSDAAPKLTGVRDTDRAREEELLEAVDALLAPVLRRGGDLVLKILEGPEAQALEKRIRARFDSAAALRPKASRKGTTERYLVGRGFKG